MIAGEIINGLGVLSIKIITSVGCQRTKLIVSCGAGGDKGEEGGVEGLFASGIINILRASKYKNDCGVRGSEKEINTYTYNAAHTSYLRSQQYSLGQRGVAIYVLVWYKSDEMMLLPQ